MSAFKAIQIIKIDQFLDQIISKISEDMKFYLSLKILIL